MKFSWQRLQACICYYVLEIEGKTFICSILALFKTSLEGFRYAWSPVMEDVLWTKLLTNIMNQQSSCGRQIYINVAHT